MEFVDGHRLLCICGGTVPVPRQLFEPPSSSLHAICSDNCGQVWEFTYDEAGVLAGSSPKLVPLDRSPGSERSTQPVGPSYSTGPLVATPSGGG